MKHTPKPWKTINMDGRYFPSVLIGKPQPYSDGSGKYQARIVVNESHDSQMKTIQANARLIASSPDLLEALKEAVNWIKRTPDLDSPKAKLKLNKLEQLITKVEGG